MSKHPAVFPTEQWQLDSVTHFPFYEFNYVRYGPHVPPWFYHFSVKVDGKEVGYIAAVDLDTWVLIIQGKTDENTYWIRHKSLHDSVSEAQQAFLQLPLGVILGRRIDHELVAGSDDG